MTSPPTSPECPALIVDDLTAPFTIVPAKGRRQSRVIVTSPHSGRQYPSRFIEQAALGLDDLRRVEDAGMDRLLGFQPLPAPLLLAEFPRSFVDANRDSGDIDAAMFDSDNAETRATASRPSHYLRWGLGVIPKKAARQADIYARPLPANEAGMRIDKYYAPFHHALGGLINNASAEGDALLLDCHSMPSDIPGRKTDIVIGSNHGKSCPEHIISIARKFFEREGLTVALNTPFAGGYITRHYGQPEGGISAMQVEICRSLYLDENRIRLKPGWQNAASILCRFIMQMDAALEGDISP